MTKYIILFKALFKLLYIDILHLFNQGKDLKWEVEIREKEDKK